MLKSNVVFQSCGATVKKKYILYNKNKHNRHTQHSKIKESRQLTRKIIFIEFQAESERL